MKICHEQLLGLGRTGRKSGFEFTEEQIRALERFDPEHRGRHIRVNEAGGGMAASILCPRVRSFEQPGDVDMFSSELPH